MKRITQLSILIITIILISTTGFASSPIDVIIGEQRVDFNVLHNGTPMGNPYIENGRTYIPIRVISENLGYNVDWVQKTQTAIIKKSNNTVEIRIGDNKALVNGVAKNIDLDSNIKVTVKNNRTYVPVRFVAEAMGEQVDYRQPGTSSVVNQTVYVNSTDLPVEKELVSSVPDGINEPIVKERIVEIKNMWVKLKPTFNEVKYNILPNTNSPYELGELSKETLNNALNTTNFIRYVAHLSSNIALDDDFNKEAQAAALLNAVNNQLTHSPSKPTNMDNRIYEMGKKGAASSNLGMGHANLITNIVNGYMNDGDSYNIDRIGHRVWILSPKLKRIGFGFARSESAMKVIDDNMWKNSYEPFDYVSWPAKTAMPIENFGTEFPWSVSLNQEKYDNKRISEVKVELVRLKDNKKWDFNNKSADGYFNVSTANYGYLPYTIIFRPLNIEQYKNGDKFKVTISNIYTLNGSAEQVSFETTFFDLTK